VQPRFAQECAYTSRNPTKSAARSHCRCAYSASVTDTAAAGDDFSGPHFFPSNSHFGGADGDAPV
jgi:hypothetical protein